MILPYSYLLILLITSAGIYSKQIKYTLFLNTIVLFLLFSLRDLGDYKNDLDDYLIFFNSIDKDSFINALFFNVQSYKGDYIFYFFAWIYKNIYNNYNFYLGMQFLVPFIIFLYAYIKILNSYQIEHFNKIINRDIYLLLFLIWISTASFYFMFGNVLRQGLSIAFLILALYMFLKDRIFLFYLYSLFSFFSHKSILLIILFMIVYKLFVTYSTRKFIFLVVLFTFIILILFTSLDLWKFFTKVLWYLTHMNHISISHLIQVLVMVLSNMFIMNYFKKRYKYIDNKFLIIWYLYIFLGFFIIISFYFTPELSQRFMLNFFTLGLILLSFLIIKLLKAKHYRSVGLILSVNALYSVVVIFNSSVNSLFVFS